MASLQHLPAELIDSITTYLSLPDLRAVRLTSRELGRKATGYYFKSFCRSKNVDLRVSDLEALADLLEPGSLAASTLEDLCISGVSFVTKSLERTLRQKTVPGDWADPMGVRRDALGNSIGAKRVAVSSEEELRGLEAELERMKFELEELEVEQKEERDLEALKGLFEKVKANCGLKGLRRLKLDVVVFRDPERSRLEPAEGAMWPDVWKIAQRTLATVVKAVAECELGAEEFDVFGQRDSCAVQVFDLSNLSDELGAFGGLKSLSLSTSNRVRLGRLPNSMDLDPDDWDTRRRGGLIRRPDPARNPDDESNEADFTDERNLLGIARWLTQLPELESLDLHSTYVPEAGLDHSYPGHEPCVLRHIASQGPRPNLKNLVLRGWSVEGDILLCLLKNSPNLQSLSLDQVALTSPTSSWDSILDYLSRPTTSLAYLRLNNCFADSLRTYVRFWSDCPSRIEGTGDRGDDVDRPAAGGGNALEVRGRETIQKGLKCRGNDKWVVGSVQQSQWRVERARQFGPMRVWS